MPMANSASMMLRYPAPVRSAITSAAAPMIGGMICPPDEAVASIPAAKLGENPRRLIIGMVNVSVPTILATVDPERDSPAGARAPLTRQRNRRHKRQRKAARAVQFWIDQVNASAVNRNRTKCGTTQRGHKHEDTIDHARPGGVWSDIGISFH
jgi:hypothetical protein